MDLIVDFPREHPPRARVSFARHVEARVVEDLSLEHKDRLWFSGEEMELFKCNLAKTVRGILSSGMTVGEYAERNVEDSSLFLGLEGYLTEDTPGEIRHRRRAGWEAVLWEQLCQRDAGVRDPEALSIVAERASEFSRRRARIVGLLHAPKTRSRTIPRDRPSLCI